MAIWVAARLTCFRARARARARAQRSGTRNRERLARYAEPSIILLELTDRRAFESSGDQSKRASHVNKYYDELYWRRVRDRPFPTARQAAVAELIFASADSKPGAGLSIVMPP